MLYYAVFALTVGEYQDFRETGAPNKRIKPTFPEGSTVYQDTGFQGFCPEGVLIVQPKKKPKGGELTSDEKAENGRISSIRIRVEHAISGVKRCRIVTDKLRNWKAGFRDLVMETCCGLHNFRLNFRQWHYEISTV